VRIPAAQGEARCSLTGCKNMISVGIAGTAKNTGKTTTLQVLLEEAQRADVRFGITSIGYDGESKDNITGLPKPRIHVQEGALVGIAQKCIPASTCRVRVLAGTGILTALGEVLVGEITEPGLLITAGPNKIRDLEILQKYMREFGCQLLFVDGALNRIIPFSLTDGIVLATGAARNADICALAEDARMFDRLLRFPFQVAGRRKDSKKARVQIVSCTGVSRSLHFSSLLTDLHVREILSHVHPDSTALEIPGALQADTLSNLIQDLLQTKIRLRIHITTPLQLIPGGSLNTTLGTLCSWSDSGGSWSVDRHIFLLAMTVNPFYPAYRFTGASYEDAYVDASELVRTVKSKVGVPVFDVRTDGSEKLWHILENKFLQD
jgi:hypothetical protein